MLSYNILKQVRLDRPSVSCDIVQLSKIIDRAVMQPVPNKKEYSDNLQGELEYYTALQDAFFLLNVCKRRITDQMDKLKMVWVTNHLSSQIGDNIKELEDIFNRITTKYATITIKMRQEDEKEAERLERAAAIERDLTVIENLPPRNKITSPKKSFMLNKKHHIAHYKI